MVEVILVLVLVGFAGLGGWFAIERSAVVAARQSSEPRASR